MTFHDENIVQTNENPVKMGIVKGVSDLKKAANVKIGGSSVRSPLVDIAKKSNVEVAVKSTAAIPKKIVQMNKKAKRVVRKRTRESLPRKCKGFGSSSSRFGHGSVYASCKDKMNKKSIGSGHRAWRSGKSFKMKQGGKRFKTKKIANESIGLSHQNIKDMVFEDSFTITS